MPTAFRNWPARVSESKGEGSVGGSLRVGVAKDPSISGNVSKIR